LALCKTSSPGQPAARAPEPFPGAVRARVATRAATKDRDRVRRGIRLCNGNQEDAVGVPANAAVPIRHDAVSAGAANASRRDRDLVLIDPTGDVREGDLDADCRPRIPAAAADVRGRAPATRSTATPADARDSAPLP